jgi:hypothetical protein
MADGWLLLPLSLQAGCDEVTAKKYLAYSEGKHKYPDLVILEEWLSRFKGTPREVGKSDGC